MSYSEALSARLVPRWEPVSRNQLLVVLLFFFFLSISEEKCCEKSQPKLSFGRREDCDLSSSSLEVCHLCFCRLSVLREAATTETNAATPTTRSEQRKRKWNDSISYFIFFNIFICGLWLAECSLDEVRMTLQSDCISTGTKTLTAVNLQNIIQFYPRAAVFLFQSNKVVTPTLLALFRSTFNVSSRQFWDVHYKLLKYSGWITQNCI